MTPNPHDTELRALAGPWKRRVNSRRNSECGSFPLAWLDWSAWWMDDSFGPGHCYLHVRGYHPDEPRTKDYETWHRVYCKATASPRLRFEDGVLYWLIDRHGPKQAILDRPAAGVDALKRITPHILQAMGFSPGSGYDHEVWCYDGWFWVHFDDGPHPYSFELTASTTTVAMLLEMMLAEQERNRDEAELIKEAGEHW